MKPRKGYFFIKKFYTQISVKTFYTQNKIIDFSTEYKIEFQILMFYTQAFRHWLCQINMTNIM